MNSTTTETGNIKSLGYNDAIIILISILGLVLFVNKKKKVEPNYKVADRPFGYWKPDHTFKTPTPKEFPNWDFNKTKPLPYRAFKHKYHVTMGIRPMDWNSWIELDNEWKYYHDLKMKRLEEQGDDLYATSDKAKNASCELLHELCSYLPARYPNLFKFENNIITIIPINESYNLNDDNLNPITTSAKLIQDDIAIMVENDDDGAYSLESGCICLAGFWRLKDKFKMKLDEIHKSGDVPQYETKLKSGMNKFFKRLTVNSPVIRNNYFIQTDEHLHWSKSIGSEHEKNIGWYTAPEAKDINQLYFRSERQSLRRLPISGAVVFTIRTYFLPVTKLCEEPYIPRRLLNGIESWSDDVEEYKGYHKFKQVLLPYLEQKAKEQELKGLDPLEEPSVYPF
ncbi:unnamed protein product [Candida verbasci]|uniref:HRQ family protein 1 n=1 Tax=Candida verbasci TaxID=1227364 RepID=A0A9W4TW39_9ASCO|nr:unnamed protein product [Candida verbasci]